LGGITHMPSYHCSDNVSIEWNKGNQAFKLYMGLHILMNLRPERNELTVTTNWQILDLIINERDVNGKFRVYLKINEIIWQDVSLFHLEPRPRATFIGPGIHGTGSARKLAVVSKAHALELEFFSTRNKFHREILRRNEVLVLTYFDRKFFLAKIAQLLRNSSSLRSQSDLSL
jgi:hypothetical protein